LGARLTAPRLSAVLTVVTELVANSVKHGPGGPIRLAVEVADDGAVLGRVEDGGHGRVAVREDVDPAKGGRGLKLVDAFTDRGGWRRGRRTSGSRSRLAASGRRVEP